MSHWLTNPSRTVALLVAAASTALAGLLLSRQPSARAFAFNEPTTADSDWAAVSVFAFQITPGHDGIALVDRQKRSICIYEYNPRRPAPERFILVAVRNFRYDCQLEQFNTDPPLETVEQWLRQARQPEPQKPVQPDSATPSLIPPSDEEGKNTNESTE